MKYVQLIVGEKKAKGRYEKVFHLGQPHMPAITHKQPQSYSKGIQKQCGISVKSEGTHLFPKTFANCTAHCLPATRICGVSRSDTTFILVQQIMTHPQSYPNMHSTALCSPPMQRTSFIRSVSVCSLGHRSACK